MGQAERRRGQRKQVGRRRVEQAGRSGMVALVRLALLRLLLLLLLLLRMRLVAQTETLEGGRQGGISD